MASGGKRKGAGRKAGTANVKTRAIADKAMSEGITPLEVMLETMRSAYDEAKKHPGAIKRIDLMKIAHDAAIDAAPYMHPKLAASSHEHTGKNGAALIPTINLAIGNQPQPAPKAR